MRSYLPPVMRQGRSWGDFCNRTEGSMAAALAESGDSFERKTSRSSPGLGGRLDSSRPKGAERIYGTAASSIRRGLISRLPRYATQDQPLWSWFASAPPWQCLYATVLPSGAERGQGLSVTECFAKRFLVSASIQFLDPKSLQCSFLQPFLYESARPLN